MIKKAPVGSMIYIMTNKHVDALVYSDYGEALGIAKRHPPSAIQQWVVDDHNNWWKSGHMDFDADGNPDIKNGFLNIPTDSE